MPQAGDGDKRTGHASGRKMRREIRAPIAGSADFAAIPKLNKMLVLELVLSCDLYEIQRHQDETRAEV
jgi:hypothetical protein